MSRFLLRFVALGLLAAPVRADDDPFAPAKKPEAGKAAAGPAWGGEGRLSFPLDHRAAVTVGPVGCPVLLVGNEVYDLKTGKPTRTLDFLAGESAVRAISADGKWVAAADRSPNRTGTAVGVWSAATGKPAFTIPGRDAAFVDFLAFSRDKYLLVGGRHDATVAVWDAATGQRTKDLTMPERRVGADKCAFSPDGRYFVVVGHDKAGVYDTATGRPVVTLAPPGTPIAGQPVPKGPAARSIDAIMTYARIEAVRFSPDGEEVAAVTGRGGSARLLVWNTKGKLVLDDPLPAAGAFGGDAVLDWLPDRSGWFVSDCVYDRASRRPLLRVKTPFHAAAQFKPRLLDQSRIAAALGDGKHVEAVPIPWDKINAARAKLRDPKAAHLSAARPVSVEVVIDGDVKNPTELSLGLTDALTARLTRDGLTVGEGGSAAVRLTVTGGADDQPAGRDPGGCVVEVVADGRPEPVWRGQLSAGAFQRVLREDGGNEAARKMNADWFVRQLDQIMIPYFVPKDEALAVLPVVLE